MKPSIVATVLGFALLATPADAQESPLISWFRHSFGPTVGEIAIVEARPVDYHGKSNIVHVRSVRMNQAIEAVKREVGAANVIEGIAQAEGETSTMYTIKLCGHEVRRTWNGVSWSDPAFRTPEGLGVGSPLAAFDTAYGRGEAIGE